jgi:hypothetical protein
MWRDACAGTALRFDRRSADTKVFFLLFLQKEKIFFLFLKKNNQKDVWIRKNALSAAA